MSKPAPKLVKIGKAAEELGVSIDTLRRWEASGKLKSIRTPGGTRLYSLETLNNLQSTSSHTPRVKTSVVSLLDKWEIPSKNTPPSADQIIKREWATFQRKIPNTQEVTTVYSKQHTDKKNCSLWTVSC